MNTTPSINSSIEDEAEENEVTTIGPKTAIVAIIGRPSAGKSTFLNTASGEKISIVSSYPQTTRNAIKGIVNTSLGQLVFVDTPGLHQSDKKLNQKLKTVTTDQLESADAILYLIDTSREMGEEETFIIELMKPYAKKTVIGLNKTDDANAKPLIAKNFLKALLQNFPEERIIELSAKDDEHVNDVLKALYDLAPIAPQLYPEEYYTDQDVDFRIAEIIREQAMNRLEQELPHTIYVSIADMEMKKPSLLWVRAFLCVERESQKGIVIGKGASKIKAIRIESLKVLKKLATKRHSA